jgi:hypothetical protein
MAIVIDRDQIVQTEHLPCRVSSPDLTENAA